NLLGKKPQPLTRRHRRPPLWVELLEDRTVMSTLPAANVQDLALGLSPLANRSNAIGPTLAVDTLDPHKILAVDSVLRTDLVPNRWVVEGAYSLDEGRTWTSVFLVDALADPNLSQASFTPFAQLTDTYVAWDRNHHFYIVESQHDAA